MQKDCKKNAERLQKENILEFFFTAIRVEKVFLADEEGELDVKVVNADLATCWIEAIESGGKKLEHQCTSKINKLTVYGSQPLKPIKITIMRCL